MNESTIVSLSAIVCHSIAATYPQEGKVFNSAKLVSSINAGIGRMNAGKAKGSKLNNGSYSAKTGEAKFIETTGQEYVSGDISVTFLVWHNQQVKVLKQWGTTANRHIAIPEMFDEFLTKHFVDKTPANKPEESAAK